MKDLPDKMKKGALETIGHTGINKQKTKFN